MNLTFVTTCYDDDNMKILESKDFEMSSERTTKQGLICLFPQVQYQEITGFGGALTDSTAYIYSLMPDNQKQEFLKKCFGKDEGKYNVVRIPLDSCDFSLEHYEADSDPLDKEFQKFSFDRVDKYIIPLLDDVEKMFGGKIDIMLSPWSPPAFMKSNEERNHGGKLKSEYQEHWANYICRYIQEYTNRGYSVTKLTLQNEPMAKQTWDSCEYTKEEQRDFLKDYMWPALVKYNLEFIEIYIWDHNKEYVFEWADTIITPETDHMVKGIAFHWYSGDHFQQLAMVREKFPDKKLLLSEACIEFSKFDKGNFLVNAQKYAHDMIGNLNAGMNTFVDWNLLLDEQGGPNHVNNFCDAPFLFDTNEKELLQRNIFDYIWHFSHFIKENSVRIASSQFASELECVAFSDEKEIVIILLNRTQEDMPVTIKLDGFYCDILLPAMSIGTGVVHNM
ncbi:MAG: glycoside hydrolase family 30 beta sandwich domain-containing protein [Eubacteriales bacterium]